MFNLGDRVVYVSGAHGRGSNNPLAGTQYECQGTVMIEDKGMGFPIQVLWDNGKTNSYSSGDLDHVAAGKTNPNTAFFLKKQKSKWS